MLRAGHAIGCMIAAVGLAALLPAVAVLPSVSALAENLSNARAAHGLALYGEPAQPKDFAHFPYAYPHAPKGGTLRLGQRGAFDSLNPFNARFGDAPQLIIGNVLQSLMSRSQDEPYSLYPLIAQSVDIDDARAYLTFHIDPRARFSDKTPILASDVLFSFELLKSKGRPNHRVIFALVKSAVVRDDILEGRWKPVQHDGSGRDRNVAKRAQALLAKAGYVLADERLQKNGVPVVFEIMIRDRDEERLALNFAASLKRIGIEAIPRLYDEVQYRRRRQRFEYDMMIGQWLPAAVPGQEQLNRWSSESLNQENSLNLAGAASPALDAAIANLLASHSKEDSLWAARALDRILLSGFYFVPLQHTNAIWCAHGAALRHSERTPLFPMLPFGFTLENWWMQSAQPP